MNLACTNFLAANANKILPWNCHSKPPFCFSKPPMLFNRDSVSLYSIDLESRISQQIQDADEIYFVNVFCVISFHVKNGSPSTQMEPLYFTTSHEPSFLLRLTAVNLPCVTSVARVFSESNTFENAPLVLKWWSRIQETVLSHRQAQCR